jgi:hypothetical protein
MKKRNFELRDRDFAACCLETVRRAGFNNERLGAAEAIARAMAMQPAAYYVSPGYAYIPIGNIRRMGADRYSTMATEPSDMMWLEIYERVMAAMENKPRRCLFTTIAEVISRRPTRFYISRRRALEIFNKSVRRDIIYTPRKTHL